MPRIPEGLAWGLAALFLVLALRGALKGLRSRAADDREGPRPGMIELGVGLGGIALLIPTLFEVYWP